MSNANKALILVDLQNDFMPGGALPVSKGDEIIDTALGRIYYGGYRIIIFTLDNHLPNHISFASRWPGKNPFESMTEENGKSRILWPDHCIRSTNGAQLHPKLCKIDPPRKIFKIYKGEDLDVDSYSGFWDDNIKYTKLNDTLTFQNIVEVDIMGLALDYCVKATAIDAVQLRFKTNVLAHECRGVDPNPIPALSEMFHAGVNLVF